MSSCSCICIPSPVSLRRVHWMTADQIVESRPCRSCTSNLCPTTSTRVILASPWSLFLSSSKFSCAGHLFQPPSPTSKPLSRASAAASVSNSTRRSHNRGMGRDVMVAAMDTSLDLSNLLAAPSRGQPIGHTMTSKGKMPSPNRCEMETRLLLEIKSRLTALAVKTILSARMYSGRYTTRLIRMRLEP